MGTQTQQVSGGGAVVKALAIVAGTLVYFWVYFGLVPLWIAGACTACSGVDLGWVLFGWIPIGLLLFGLLLAGSVYLLNGRRQA